MQPAAAQDSAGTKRPLEEEEQIGPQAKRQETDQPAAPQRELVYRLLVPANKAGLAIGAKGVVANQIETKTGAKIKVIEGVPGCDERVIIISSVDDPNDAIPGAQVALFEVHKRCVQSDDPEASVSTRMLIAISQAGYIIGKQGRTIGETKDASGAMVKVLRESEVPICGLENDRLLQINGTTQQTVKALQILAEQIRFQTPKEMPGGPVPHLPIHNQNRMMGPGPGMMPMGPGMGMGGPGMGMGPGMAMGMGMGMGPGMGMGMGPGRPMMPGPPGGMPAGGYGGPRPPFPPGPPRPPMPAGPGGYY